MAVLANLTPADTFVEVETKVDAAIDSLNLITAGNTLKTEVIQIGDWDMDTNQNLLVPHGLADLTKIRLVEVMILEDDSSTITALNSVSVISDGMRGGVLLIDSTNLNLYRVNGDLFDSTDYNATSFNRGFITITYEK